MFKKIFLASNLLLAMLCYEASAQSGSLTNAILYLEDNDPVKAKIEIDAVVKNEKTSTSAKAWYYRGMTYSKLVTDNPANADKGFTDTAAVSFVKAKAFDKPNGQFAQMSDLRLQDLWVTATNDGVKKYQAADYKGAVKSFKSAHLANPKDTTALLYGSYAATASNDLRQAFVFTEDLKANNYYKSHVYKIAADYYLESGDKAKAESELKEGLLKNPNDPAILQELANFYITTDKNEQAVQTLALVEKVSPNDPLVLNNIAVQYQKLNQADQAEKYYLKVLALEPNNYIALFNLGNLYIDKSRPKFNAYNTLNAEQLKKQGPALKAELISNYTKAIDYCQKALAQTKEAEDKEKLTALIADLESVLKGLSK
jgi:tetratricopeptide (TPR) repeat protein